MQTMFENLQNGNLKDARTQAKRYKLNQIIYFLHFDVGWTARKSNLAAIWLKTGQGWQMFCDER